MPPLPLAATDGSWVDVAALPGRTVLYVYPLTGRPDQPLPADRDLILGARGCMPQFCAFRDHHAEGGGGAGLRSECPGHGLQREAAQRLHLPFPLLSGAELRLAGGLGSLGLPTFEVSSLTLLRRVTLVLRGGLVEHVFSPVFPPDRNAADVLAWLGSHPA